MGEAQLKLIFFHLFFWTGSGLTVNSLFLVSIALANIFELCRLIFSMLSEDTSGYKHHWHAVYILMLVVCFGTFL